MCKLARRPEPGFGGPPNHAVQSPTQRVGNRGWVVGLMLLGSPFVLACRPIEDGEKLELDSAAPHDGDVGNETGDGESGDGIGLAGADIVRRLPSVGIDCPADLFTTNFMVSAVDAVDPLGEGLEYRWKLVSAPQDAGVYEPAGNYEVLRIWPGLAGDYVISLRVVDAAGRSSPVVTCETVAVPNGALFMELFWWSEAAEAGIWTSA